MDICTVLQQVKALTGALPEIYSEELSEDDWWHKAMGCHFHACPFGYDFKQFLHNRIISRNPDE